MATGLQTDGAGLQRHRGRAVTHRHTPSDARVLAVGCRTKLISRGAARICANQDLPQPITKHRPTEPWALKLRILQHKCACLFGPINCYIWSATWPPSYASQCQGCTKPSSNLQSPDVSSWPYSKQEEMMGALMALDTEPGPPIGQLQATEAEYSRHHNDHISKLRPTGQKHQFEDVSP